MWKGDVLDVNGWMCRRKGKRNCEPPYLPDEENRVYIEMKGAFCEGAIFSVAISACWFRGIILKNSWWNSLPGTLRSSREQSSHILKLDVFGLLPVEPFLLLFFLSIVYRCAFCCVQATNPLHLQGLRRYKHESLSPQRATVKWN